MSDATNSELFDRVTDLYEDSDEATRHQLVALWEEGDLDTLRALVIKNGYGERKNMEYVDFDALERLVKESHPEERKDKENK